MPPSSTSSAARALTLVPFLYFVRTRVKGNVDFAYLVASSWIPAIWIAFRLTDLGPEGAALSFLAGYLCFIAIYEIGYLANDVWDARKDPAGRQRLGFVPGPTYVILFVLVRLATWAAVARWFGWLDDLLFLSFYAALVAAFAQHNLIRSAALRSASFYQLSLLRFSAPIIGLLQGAEVAVTLLIAALLYSYFRFLSYLESKSLLAMPERRRPAFGLIQTAMLMPTLLFAAFATGETLILEIGLYLLLLYGLWRLAAPGKGAEAA